MRAARPYETQRSLCQMLDAWGPRGARSRLQVSVPNTVQALEVIPLSFDDPMGLCQDIRTKFSSCTLGWCAALVAVPCATRHSVNHELASAPGPGSGRSRRPAGAAGRGGARDPRCCREDRRAAWPDRDTHGRDRDRPRYRATRVDHRLSGMGQDPLACDRLLERTTTPAR